jgi:hypothetical protein
MAYTSAQLNKMAEILATNITDDMDEATLREYVYDMMMENMRHLGEEDMMNELWNWYGEDELVEKVIHSATLSEPA